MFIRAFTHELETRLRGGTKFLQIVLGPRQVGKTTGLKQIIEKWEHASVYCSADLPAPPDNQWIIEHWKKARLAGPNCLLVIDEVQKIDRWSEVVKALYDEDIERSSIRVVLLGSASISLQAGLSESLLGRYELIRANHWDPYECNQAFGWDINSFLKFGGYPGPESLTTQPQRWQRFMQDAVIEPIIAKDILALKQVGNIALFRQSFELAMSYPARELSYQKLLGQLQDKGNAATIKSYLLILEKAFVLKVIEKYSNKPIKVKSSSPKLIPLAPALTHAFTSSNRVDQDSAWRGQIFEAAVISKAATLPGDIYYWRDGRDEVDFVWQYEDRLIAFEVKSTKTNKKTKGLLKFSEAFPQARCLTIDEELSTRFLLSEAPLDLMLEFYEKS